MTIGPAAASAMGLRESPDTTHVLLTPGNPQATTNEATIVGALPIELRLDTTTTTNSIDPRIEQDQRNTRAIGLITATVAVLITAVLAAIGATLTWSGIWPQPPH
ncbi:hypothetical protein [Kibdelosporangium phytohabitans]|uniref:Uncharacterized protein n=1 Tax=Kibdelosporangium phytohabitans TaxID=860235 RepID=A0A0N9I4M3_9PSEU|nr:hypothetical protein [Kibdelosporangium phytohabitans]ALG09501.1 hypothetical protein AOZ06_23650 [Kibdelosporangium phytohabitans]MBE1469198.1 hypothetical protein [Kibdelosporangium phytohabitans]